MTENHSYHAPCCKCSNLEDPFNQVCTLLIKPSYCERVCHSDLPVGWHNPMLLPFIHNHFTGFLHGTMPICFQGFYKKESWSFGRTFTSATFTNERVKISYLSTNFLSSSFQNYFWPFFTSVAKTACFINGFVPGALLIFITFHNPHLNSMTVQDFPWLNKSCFINKCYSSLLKDSNLKLFDIFNF